MLDEFSEVIERKKRELEKIERMRKSISKNLRKIKDFKFKIGNISTSSIINPVNPFKGSAKAAAIDGGLGVKVLHGTDLVVLRASGIYAEFDGKNFENFKSKTTSPEVLFYTSREDGDLTLFANLNRMKKEIALAIEFAEEYDIDFLLLDGPVYPHPSVRAAKGGSLKEDYEEVLKLYGKLIDTCKARGIEVVGVVEDSRSAYLTRILEEKIFPAAGLEEFGSFASSFRDTVILYDALLEGERTFTFKLTNVSEVSYGEEIFSFYIKTASRDRPIRVEFVGREDIDERADRIASFIYATSAFKSYGIPSLLIVADLKAKIDEHFMYYLLRRLGYDSSPTTGALRRERRPF